MTPVIIFSYHIKIELISSFCVIRLREAYD